MRTRGPKQLYCLALSALLFLPAVPALAEGESFELHLEEALALQGAGLLLDEIEAMDGSTELEPTPETNLTEVRLESLPETSARMAEQAAEDDMAAEAKPKGFGRWLKKHWYVPVLVAVAIGVVVVDDDDDGEEDDD